MHVCYDTYLAVLRASVRMLISALVIAEKDLDRGREVCTLGVKFALPIG